MKLLLKTNTLLKLSVLTFAFFGLLMLVAPAPSYAQLGGDDPAEFDDIQTDSSCSNTGTPAQLRRCLRNNKIVVRVQQVINFLSIGVAVVVIAMIIIGGIQYMMAGGNSQAVSEAKKRITNALLALLAFIFTFAFLQWLIPGGVFR